MPVRVVNHHDFEARPDQNAGIAFPADSQSGLPEKSAHPDCGREGGDLCGASSTGLQWNTAALRIGTLKNGFASPLTCPIALSQKVLPMGILASSRALNAVLHQNPNLPVVGILHQVQTLSRMACSDLRTLTSPNVAGMKHGSIDSTWS